MPKQAQLTIFSPAKVNVYLRILGRRPDGYHDLETVMLPLDFGDTMTFEACPAGVELTCDDSRLPVDDTNLVVRAAKRLAERCSVKRGAKIRLEKRTPLAAGLGGGSSNAATTLTGLDQLWSLHAPRSTLHDLAAGMGSDINFFLTQGAALCRGRGERVEPLPCKFSATILLINPGFGISTKWAYESWAEASSAVSSSGQERRRPGGRSLIGNRRDGGVPHANQNFELPKAAAGLTVAPPDATLLGRALASDDLDGVCRALYNSLEAPSVRKFPVLQLLKDAMRDGGASGALMSGSGATVFGLFAEKSAAETCAAAMREEFGPSMWTCVTRCRGME